MDAIVLVGGEGTRLRPLTYDIPKQMLPVVDRPMIEHVVAFLAGFGVDRVVLSLGYRYDTFVKAYPERKLAGARLAFAVEQTLLDTAGAVRFAARHTGVEGTCLVLNADVLTDFDLDSLVALHRERGAEATIQLAPVEDPSRFGVVPVDGDGRVTAFIEKPPRDLAPTNYVNAGCYVLEPSVIARIPEGRRVSIERETFPQLAASGTLYALASEAYWLDTGTPEKFLQASLDVLKGLRSERCRPAAPLAGDRVYADPSAVLAGSVGPASYLGRGAVVEDGASVEEAVLLDGVVAAAGSVVSGSVVMAGTRIGEDTVLRSSIVGPGTSIGPSSKISGYSIIAASCEVPPGSVLDGGRFPRP